MATGTSGPETVENWSILKADVSKTHRRVKILRPGWGFQVAVNKGHYWINKVGAYGMASAQLYWGRTAALLLRLLYSAFPMFPWHFVYVDDFAWILPKQEDGTLAMSVLAFLLALGLPLSWKKTEPSHSGS